MTPSRSRTTILSATALGALLAAALVSVPAPGVSSAPPKFAVTAKLSKTAATKGTKVSVSGKVTPTAKAAGSKVKLQSQSGSRWKTVAKDTLNSNGKYDVSWTPTSTGTVKLRVQKGAGHGLAKGVGKTLELIVRPAPTGLGDELAVGDAHACAVGTGGGVKCWGGNEMAQLGTGSASAPIATAVSVTGLGSLKAIGVATGRSHSCAVFTNGTVRCWGSNQYGQLGIGTTGAPKATPTQVSGLTNAVAIDAGIFFTCAVLKTGSVSCWGNNGYHELGNGQSTLRKTPGAVSGIVDALSISSGDRQTCARLSGGTVRCWGDNTYGSLGHGNTAPALVPVSVVGVSGATSVATSGSHGCAVVAGGAVKCWGANGTAQVGQPAGGSFPTPVQISGLTGAKSVGAGSFQSCAVMGGGAMACFGNNTFGELGNGSTGGNSATPLAVSSMSGATLATGGYGYTCARLASGAVRCWGDNEYKQLGDGSGVDRNVPGPVLNVP